MRPVFELRAGGSNPKAVPRTAQSPGGLPPLEVDSTHRRLPVASDPSTLTFYGENVPKGTGVMQSELRGELGEEADLSGASDLATRSWTRPLGVTDAAVRLGGGEHGAQQPVERPQPSRFSRLAVRESWVSSMGGCWALQRGAEGQILGFGVLGVSCTAGEGHFAHTTH